MSDTLNAAADAELAGIDFGEDAGTGQQRIVLPSGFYPVDISVNELTPSKRAGTPGLALEVTVNEGPFKNVTLNKFDSTIWLTPGKPTSQKADGSKPNKRTMLPMLAHICRAVTGKKANYNAMGRFGYVEANGDGIAVAEGAKEWFFALTEDERISVMSEVFHTAQFEGKSAVASITWTSEPQLTAEGAPRLDEQGQPMYRDKNQIKNFFSVNDEAHGLAQVRKREFPKQEEQFTAMNS